MKKQKCGRTNQSNNRSSPTKTIWSLWESIKFFNNYQYCSKINSLVKSILFLYVPKNVCRVVPNTISSVWIRVFVRISDCLQMLFKFNCSVNWCLNLWIGHHSTLDFLSTVLLKSTKNNGLLHRPTHFLYRSKGKVKLWLWTILERNVSLITSDISHETNQQVLFYSHHKPCIKHNTHLETF